MRSEPISANPNFAAALLAGGRSSRMGFDKAAAIFDGEPLWRRQLATLRALGAAELFISGKPDGPYARSGCEIVTDIVPDQGPLAGLDALLQRTAREWLVVLAIDLPLVSAPYLRGLMDEAQCREIGAVPKGARGFEPFAAVYPRSMRALVRECLGGPDRSMQNVLRLAEGRALIAASPIAAADAPLFRNLNSPADLAQPGGSRNPKARVSGGRSAGKDVG